MTPPDPSTESGTDGAGGSARPTDREVLSPAGTSVPTPEPSVPGAEAPPSGPQTLPPARLGASTFTIEGRSAPALFVIGWIAAILGLGLVLIGVVGGRSGGAILLVFLGLLLLSVGLIAGAGSQGIERRVRGVLPYVGPSPFLVFAATIPISVLAVAIAAIPLVIAGVPLDGPLAALLSVSVQALVYLALVRLLVVDTGSLSWASMGVRRFDATALTEIGGGALWAVPVIAVTVPVVVILQVLFPVTPVSPLPPTGESVGFAISLLAGVIVAPLGEELLFRGFATTAWAKAFGARRGLIQAALVFALAHVLTISGDTAGDAFGQAVVGFAARVPVALALGWIFLRRGTIWASFGLHAAFNGILLVIAEAASRSI